MTLALLIIAHLMGDFLLQNHWMQAKSRSSFVCSVHVACYALPFLSLMLVIAIPGWIVATILLQHWAQDRYALHLRWMKLYKQTPPELWPTGPLCVDQAMHLAFIGLVSLTIL